MSAQLPPTVPLQLTGHLAVNAVHATGAQDVIVITEDRLRLILLSHVSKIERRRVWWTPLGLFLALLLAFPTTDFKPFLNLPADTWRAFFIMACFFSGVWLIQAVIASLKSPSISDVVEQVKKGVL